MTRNQHTRKHRQHDAVFWVLPLGGVVWRARCLEFTGYEQSADNADKTPTCLSAFLVVC